MKLIMNTFDYFYFFGDTADKPLKDLGLELPIVGHTEHISFKADWICRGNEIEKWLCNNFDNKGTKFGSDRSEIYKYVILDDDTDFLLNQKDSFIKVDGYTGLTKRHINKAKKILGLE